MWGIIKPLMLRIKIKRATNIPVAPITPAVPRAISRRRAMVNTIARRVGIGLAAVVLLSIGFQLVYPGDFTLPYAQLGGTATGVRTRSELMIMLQNSFATSKVEVTAGPHIITDSLPQPRQSSATTVPTATRRLDYRHTSTK